MENVTAKIERNELVLRVKLDTKRARPSSTGKTLLLASSHGAQLVPGSSIPGLKVALNVTIPPTIQTAAAA
ncbi:MAG: hypothetical protein ACREEN_00355 [Stellaceae bacterium]